MNFFYIFWIILQILIGYHLIFPIILYLFFKVKKSTGSEDENIVKSDNERDYAIIVTAYEQTNLLYTVVESILKLNYSNYLIYVVADNCDISNLYFNSDKVILLRPEIVLSSNTRSHFYAISNFVKSHDVLTIIDSDNIVDSEYLNELNIFFDKGYEAVQGVRAAKNLNSTLACLDAARDIYYHFYDGEVLFALGSSATLAGSGMAFKTSLYRECLEKLDITGAGFDKVLQAQIVGKNKRIAFSTRAIVYDEKTSKSDQLINQRSRWINTWFRYFGFGFNILWKGIKSLSINQFLFGLVLLRPPLFMFIFGALLFAFINLFVFPLMSLFWAISLLLFVLGFYIALKHYPTDRKIYSSLINIPKFMYFQLVSLIHSRNANKRSIATKHSIVDKE